MEKAVSIYSPGSFNQIPGAIFTKQLSKNLGLSSFLSETFTLIPYHKIFSSNLRYFNDFFFLSFILDFSQLMNDKIMFDRYYCINSKKTNQKLRKCLRTSFFSHTTIFLRTHAFL